MRPILTARPLIAATGLALAAASLTLTPAHAAAGTITSAQVLAAAAAARADTNGTQMSVRAVRVLANRACDVKPDDEFAFLAFGAATSTHAAVDGLVGFAQIMDANGIDNGDIADARYCAFGALTATDPGAQLSGTASFLGTTYKLSGNVFVTPAIDPSAAMESSEAPTFVASGKSSMTTTTTTKVSTPKSAQQLKSARKARAKALTAAKAKYTKAKKKATSKSAKAAAARAYAAKKAAIAKTYQAATATSKTVVTSKTTSRPFAVSAVFADA